MKDFSSTPVPAGTVVEGQTGQIADWNAVRALLRALATSVPSTAAEVGAIGSDSPVITGQATFDAPVNASAPATRSYVDGVIQGLVRGAPATLDTIQELAAALGNNPNQIQVILDQLAQKLDLAGGTMAGPIVLPAVDPVGQQAVSKAHLTAALSAAGTASIPDASVTSAKIADAAVTAVKLASGAVTKTSVGLAAVDNTADSAKPVSTAQATALAAKAPTASPALTGTPTAPTAPAGTNTTQLATAAFVTAAVAAIPAGGASAATPDIPYLVLLDRDPLAVTSDTFGETGPIEFPVDTYLTRFRLRGNRTFANPVTVQLVTLAGAVMFSSTLLANTYVHVDSGMAVHIPAGTQATLQITAAGGAAAGDGSKVLAQWATNRTVPAGVTASEIASAGVTRQNVTTGTGLEASSPTTDTGFLSLSHTVAPDTTLLLVAVEGQDQVSGSTVVAAPFTVSVNGAAATNVARAVGTNSTNGLSRRASIFSFVGAPAGPATIEVHQPYPASAGGTPRNMRAAVVGYSNAKVGSGKAIDASTTGTPTATSLALTFTDAAAAGSKILTSLCVRSGTAPIPGSGQTSLDAYLSGSNTYSEASEGPAGAASVTVSESWATADIAALVGVSVVPI